MHIIEYNYINLHIKTAHIAVLLTYISRQFLSSKRNMILPQERNSNQRQVLKDRLTMPKSIWKLQYLFKQSQNYPWVSASFMFNEIFFLLILHIILIGHILRN